MKMENISLSEQLNKWCEITKRNKRVHVARQAYSEYLNSNDTRLEHVYGKYSISKLYTYNEIMDEMQKMGGHGFTIISFNHQMFTCGYTIFFDEGIYFVRHTPSYRDCVKVG